ncbi:PH domain-containing protein [Staphylococcus felis]|uniref:YdbS-like PH domain-containing protein n=1 Tax=Staphylococcus felis TaxID=46127 RepID=A0A3E0IM01_9STAP|nr:PH domain-containing protein [Staphylococcus felis]REH82473.1 hypothetical protein DOS61_09095 [Staphylococcus felis]REH89469.1 hypothetical protein DOS58_06660 [Staphylococcus felis]REH91304.1 hypothetical protein DOS83_11515 [Staphylococcus felis]
MAHTFQKSPKCTRGYLFQYHLIHFLIDLFILGGLTFLWYYFNWRFEWIYLITLMTVVSILYHFIYPQIYYAFNQYRIVNNRIEIKRNIWFRKFEVMKFERIQFLTRSTGPLLRRHNLCVVSLVTAGHSIKLPYISLTEAQHIETHCLNYIEGGDDDV